QRPAVGELLVGRCHPAKEVGGGAGLDLEDIEPRCDVPVEEIRLGKAEIDLLRAQRDHGRDAQVLPAPEEVALADAAVDQRSGGGRETEPKRRLSGTLLIDIGRYDGPVRGRSR